MEVGRERDAAALGHRALHTGAEQRPTQGRRKTGAGDVCVRLGVQWSFLDKIILSDCTLLS